MFGSDTNAANQAGAPAIATSPPSTIVTPSMLGREEIPKPAAMTVPPPSAPPMPNTPTAMASSRYLDTGGPSHASGPSAPSNSYIETNNGVPAVVSKSPAPPPLPSGADDLI